MNRTLVATLLVAASAGASACSHANSAGPTGMRDQMLDPTQCAQCHQSHYLEWSASMHAYASDDPVFLAMNQRGQRETNGQLGAFCVNCHAPMAVRDGLTKDGLNLASLPPKYHGVTCFFCHTVASVDGSHNAALSLDSAKQPTIRGEYTDSRPNSFHSSTYASTHDAKQRPSADMCGACHDIAVTQTDGGASVEADIERTFQEWQHTLFANAPGEQDRETCAKCHMDQSEAPIASGAGMPVRDFHAHSMPGVDIRLGAQFQGPLDSQLAAIQEKLAGTVQGALCVTQQNDIHVVLDNVSAGHGWPSGAAQDRRAWAEIIAFDASNNVIFQSGVVPDGGSVIDTGASDPNLWLLRDCMLGWDGKPVDMFWQAVTTEGNELPGTITAISTDPNYGKSHIGQSFPRAFFNGAQFPQNAGLMQTPARVTLRVRIQPIGLDVINDLTTPKDGVVDLDPDAGIAGQMPIFDLAFGTQPDGGLLTVLEWTPDQATVQPALMNGTDGTVTCVTSGGSPPGIVLAIPAPTRMDCSP